MEDLEQRLRDSFAELRAAAPQETSQTLAGARRRAEGQRRRQFLRGLGATTTVAAGTAAALVLGMSLHGQPHGGDADLGSGVATPTSHVTSPTVRPGPATSTPEYSWPSLTPTIKGGELVTPGQRYPGDLPHSQVPPTLLPHDNQLPAGIFYDTIYDPRFHAETRTSRAYASNKNMPVTGICGSSSAATPTTRYPATWSLLDMAISNNADGDPKQRYLGTAVAQFSSGTAAQGAMADILARRGAWVLFNYQRIGWSGQNSGTHWLFHGLDYVAVQAVGSYLISAQSTSRAQAQSTLATLVTNLKSAGLVK